MHINPKIPWQGRVWWRETIVFNDVNASTMRFDTSQQTGLRWFWIGDEQYFPPEEDLHVLRHWNYVIREGSNEKYVNIDNNCEPFDQVLKAKNLSVTVDHSNSEVDVVQFIWTAGIAAGAGNPCIAFGPGENPFAFGQGTGFIVVAP
jgi:hypothetical protein